MTAHTWPIETEDQIEALARECEWNNRRFMTAKDYSIWCERMRKFARLAKIEEPAAPDCEYCIDGLQADGETPCPCRGCQAPAPASKEWRCFHCDEVFTEEHSAKLHFGMDQCSDPACVIKMGAEKSLLVALRKAENELADAWAAIHNESTESAKAYYAQQSRHGEQLRAAEELGFERGIAEVKQLRNKVAARSLTDAELIDEIYAVDATIDAGFGEGGGSPGEWWYERANELEAERKRRELENQLQHHNFRAALATTGGEHHEE